jgi:AraC-like DNA-binding protein
MSERQNQRKLKAITNKSPNQLISSVRLHCAKELLIRQEYNIAEIAFKTGFSNPSYFTKSFKKEFGVTPSELLQNQYCNCRKCYCIHRISVSQIIQPVLDFASVKTLIIRPESHADCLIL